MKKQEITCQKFELLLSDYLEGSLDDATYSKVAQHALQCPICHKLLNDVREVTQLCRKIQPPEISSAQLESKIILATIPDARMSCEEFEEYLTDYLDGFLPAPIFHRWERHALLCQKCTDLPGLVVRSIAACYSFKEEELNIPETLTERILKATSSERQKHSSLRVQALIFTLKRWLYQLTPQLTPVATILLFFIFVLIQTTDGNIIGLYRKSFELAEQTYRQSANIVLGQEKQTLEKVEK
ncbi:MAG: zf-HC2 domain-containing protein [Acidobacteriota bacterium]|nr:zf-HC2 domain-containing protein [Pyrinomonadaceae bacterium]MDW8305036.1 zf-HC2 domain-containing protein [Acidobacteriota bacterium]